MAEGNRADLKQMAARIIDLVESDLASMGTRLEIFEDNMGDERLYATVVPTPFYDPEGKRMKM